MASSSLLSIFGVLNKLQEKFSSTASSSCTFDVPKLKQLNDMVYEVHSPQPGEKPEVEVVFFHGLQVRRSEDAYVTTWMTRDNSQLWLRTWLVELFPKARIFTVSYDSSAKRTRDSGRLDMYCLGENLVSSLTADAVRIGQAGCPVVLVGHCLGGLVLKELCLHVASLLGRKSAERFGVQSVDDLFSNLRGMFFYATPNTGSIFGDKLHDYFKGALMEEIKTMKASSARRNEEFADLKSKYAWSTFGIGEVHKTYVECLGKYIHMVPEASTRSYMDTYYSAAADHYNVCKPQSKEDSALIYLQDFLKKIQNDGVLRARATADLDKVTKQDESYYMVPFLKVADYVQRIDLLESIKSAVQQRREEQQRQVVVLLGMGGQGKSQLAMEYCKTTRLSKEFRAIFWIDAYSIKSVHRSFELIASKIAHPSRIFENIEEKVAFVKDTMDGWDSRWLLVFDNYDAPSTDFNVAAFFPSSPSGTILVTSRHEDSKRLGKVIPLEKMTEQESLLLLLRRSENELTDETRAIGKSIVAKLGFLPLAIDQAGAFISEQKLPLTQFLKRFDLEKEEILKYTHSLTEYRRVLGDDEKETALNVFTTWELSFQQIQTGEIGERLRSFLTTVAFFNTQDIGEDLFHNANDLETVPLWIDTFISEGEWDSVRYRKVLAELSKLSLLNFALEDTKQCRFYLHPLIADWLRLRVGLEIRRLCTIESCYLLAKLIESTDLLSCSYAFRLYLLEHVDKCLNNRRTYSKPIDEDIAFANIFTAQFGKLLLETSHYKEGISLVEEALPIFETTYGKEHVSTLSIIHDLGVLYTHQGELAKAEEMHKRALAGEEKALGKDHASTLATVSNLGVLYKEQGKLAKAEEMHKHALAGYEKAHGKDHASTLTTIHNLGVLYCKQGKLVEAEEMYKRALQGREKALGKDHTSTLDIVNNLGVLYEDQGKLAEGEEMFKRALVGFEKALGKDHAYTCSTVHNLGVLYRKQGKLGEAEEMYKRALAGKEKAFGKDHASTFDTVHNLGILYFDQGKFVEAEEMYKRAFVGFEKARGKNHASTLTTINNLGILYSNQGKWAEAEEMCKRALVGNEKAFGKDHALTLTSVHSLGALYTRQGKLAEGEEMHKRALVGYKKALGKDHASTLTTIFNLGALYSKQGKLAEGEEMYKRALVGYEKALGKNHATTLTIVNNLGALYLKQGKLAKGEEMYKRTLAEKEKALGKDHNSTLDTVCSMANLMEKQEDLKGASQMFERAYSGYMNLLGVKNHKTIHAGQELERISHLQRKKSQYKEGPLEKSTTRAEVKDGLSSKRD